MTLMPFVVIWGVLAAVAHKVQMIDKWGKLLTVVAVIYALLLAAAFVYQTFVNQATTTGM